MFLVLTGAILCRPLLAAPAPAPGRAPHPDDAFRPGSLRLPNPSPLLGAPASPGPVNPTRIYYAPADIAQTFEARLTKPYLTRL